MEPAMGTDPMRLALYKAAVEGKPQDYSTALRQQTGAAVEDDGLEVMPNGNTVLHVAVLHSHENFVEKILQGNDNHAALSLLFAQNKKKQTALHCAAEKGYDNIVSVLIQKSKDLESGTGATRMIEMRDNVMDTALHKAVRMGHLEVVKLLAIEDTEFVYPPNIAGETPIYIAAKSGFHDCLQKLLETCKYPTYGGPLGRNALHATMLSSPSTGCTELLLKKEISLCEMTDDSGCTPLHYAIKIHDNKTARMILEGNSFAAYIWPRKGDDEWTTVFHMAARHGNVEMMKYMSNSFPDCWMMLNSKCQNVLHEAVLQSGRLNVIKYVLKYPQIGNLIDEEDENGNTPLDLSISSWNPLLRVAMWKYLICSKLQHQIPSDMAFQHRMWAFSKFFLGWKLVRSGGRIGCQSDLTKNPKEKKEDVGRDNDIGFMVEASKTSIIAASLILTVTFTAGLTVPGGYNSNPGKAQGTAMLLPSFSFQIFIIFDFIAFICSILSILFHLVMVAEASSTKNYKFIKNYFEWSTFMIQIAALVAVGAFMFGMIATLAPLQSLAYTVSSLGLCSVIPVSYVLTQNWHLCLRCVPP